MNGLTMDFKQWKAGKAIHKPLNNIADALEPGGIDRRNFRETVIGGVECRPDRVRPGDLFVCVDEYLVYNLWREGRSFIETARNAGAAALIAGEAVPGWDVPQIIVPRPRIALGEAARAFYDAPDDAVATVGITGTNGKTTTTRLLAHILRKTLGSCASMGTLGLELGGETLDPGEYTTPLSPVTYARLDRLRDLGVPYAGMEVSSHGLALDRVAGLNFAGGILTNFSRDHLDFHGSLEAYAAAKKRLLESLGTAAFAVINRDTERFDKFSDGLRARRITYGFGPGSDWSASEVDCGPKGSRFRATWRGAAYPVESLLVGRFQTYNILAALATAVEMGASPEAAARAVTDFAPAPGRMESYPLPNGAVAIIDFAHNPDGLRHLLENCRALLPGRMIAVFGCGGDRDKGKRPLMGRIASVRADLCWLTSDNPRTEDPAAIIEDIREGCLHPERLRVVPDRAAAIREAYAATTSGDVLVIAGKGHETCQLVGDTKLPYSDREEVLRLRVGG